uniref:Uncharacterized protein n=1 Tax=Rhizophora mucronata TaxID=61149 RepID=A0A2P2NEV5_RHIMU
MFLFICVLVLGLIHSCKIWFDMHHTKL